MVHILYFYIDLLMHSFSNTSLAFTQSNVTNVLKVCLCSIAHLKEEDEIEAGLVYLVVKKSHKNVCIKIFYNYHYIVILPFIRLYYYNTH